MSDRYATCPYHSFAPASRWKKAFSGAPLSIQVPKKFRIERYHKISTAGSCFAQHVANRLQRSGFNYYVAEDVPNFFPQEVRRSFNYGTFSARYGNVYTARQFSQLLKRAYGSFSPLDEFWQHEGTFIDPLRPHIQPNGFASLEQYRTDKEQHLAAVRSIVEASDVFVFTMGLTEAWIDSRDGTVFPVCPGCGAGTFSPDIHAFHNFDYEEVVSDMREAIGVLNARNGGIKIILTVSPVPLDATASGDHVLTATTYSKSVLRAAAGKLAGSIENVFYFPSYEIITGPHARGAYYDDDLRTIRAEGVDHVMRIFFENFTDGQPHEIARAPDHQSHIAKMAVICDEEMQTAGLA